MNIITKYPIDMILLAGLDHDDESSQYNDTDNVLVYGGIKYFDGINRTSTKNLIIMPGLFGAIRSCLSLPVGLSGRNLSMASRISASARRSTTRPTGLMCAIMLSTASMRRQRRHMTGAALVVAGLIQRVGRAHVRTKTSRSGKRMDTMWDRQLRRSCRLSGCSHWRASSWPCSDTRALLKAAGEAPRRRPRHWKSHIRVFGCACFIKLLSELHKSHGTWLVSFCALSTAQHSLTVHRQADSSLM